MNEFEEDKIGYTVKFSIIIQNHKGECFGFIAREVDDITFNESPTFKTKNDAIDAVIRNLSKLRDKE